MKNSLTLSLYSVLFVPLLFTLEAEAAIYKCVKPSNEVYYHDKPCPENEKESTFTAIKDPVGGYIPPAFVPDQPEANAKGVVIGKASDGSTESSGASSDNDSNALQGDSSSSGSQQSQQSASSSEYNDGTTTSDASSDDYSSDENAVTPQTEPVPGSLREKLKNDPKTSFLFTDPEP